MLKLALQNNDWIRLSSWECRQNEWTQTKRSLQYHQNLLNSRLSETNDVKNHIETEDLDWIPENLKKNSDSTPIEIKLLCGADLLETFSIPGVWAEEDVSSTHILLSRTERFLSLIPIKDRFKEFSMKFFQIILFYKIVPITFVSNRQTKGNEN